MDPQAPGRPPRPDPAASRRPDAVAKAPPPPGLRSRLDVIRLAMDGAAAAILLAGLALLPLALPANAAEPGRVAAARVADHPEPGRCQHQSLLAHLS